MVRGGPLGLGLPRGRPELLWGLKQRQMRWGEALGTSPCSLKHRGQLEKLCGGSRAPAPIPVGFCFPPPAEAREPQEIYFFFLSQEWPSPGSAL